MLPAISKVFERVVYEQLYNYFAENNYLCENQYGFRKLHSAEFATLELVDRVTLALYKSNIGLALYLDLSKAFDTLNFDILLSKLNFYGVHGINLAWFKSYLENRQNYVEIYGYKSEITTSSLGVPQGSILGPLLFNIYINDILFSSEFFNFINYADDATLLNTLSNKCSHDLSH